MTGLFGLLGLGLLVWLFLQGWLQKRQRLDKFDLLFWSTTALYIVFQSIVDVSMLHWPLSICVTSLCLSVSLQRSSPQKSLVSDSMAR